MAIHRVNKNQNNGSTTESEKIYTSADGLIEDVKQHNDKRCFLYFVGTPNHKGESWCADCRVGKEIFELLSVVITSVN